MSDPTATISASSLVADVAPYILSVAGVVIPVLAAMAVAEFKKLTGIQISQAAVAKLDTLAKAGAGAAIAASETNLAGVAIPVGSATVRNAMTRIVADAPKVLVDAGLSPDNVATLIAGHIGSMQASSAAAPIAVAPLAKAS